jgi:hypothetical protein
VTCPCATSRSRATVPPVVEGPASKKDWRAFWDFLDQNTERIQEEEKKQHRRWTIELICLIFAALYVYAHSGGNPDPCVTGETPSEFCTPSPR